MTPSLESAVKALDIAQSMQYHRAIHDAQYTAQIMQKLKDEGSYRKCKCRYIQIHKDLADEIVKDRDFLKNILQEVLTVRKKLLSTGN